MNDLTPNPEYRILVTIYTNLCEPLTIIHAWHCQNAPCQADLLLKEKYWKSVIQQHPFSTIMHDNGRVVIKPREINGVEIEVIYPHGEAGPVEQGYHWADDPTDPCYINVDKLADSLQVIDPPGEN